MGQKTTKADHALTKIEVLERDLIMQSCREHDFNFLKVAKDLGMARSTLYRKLFKYFKSYGKFGVLKASVELERR